MVKSLFTDKPTYNRITACRITVDKLEEEPKSNVPLWRKCKEWMIKKHKDTSTEPQAQAIYSNSEQ